MKINTLNNFLHEYPLEYSIRKGNSEKEFDKMLLKVQEGHVLEIKKEKDDIYDYVNYEITVPRTSFANSYAHIGAEYRALILSGKIEF